MQCSVCDVSHITAAVQNEMPQCVSAGDATVQDKQLQYKKLSSIPISGKVEA